MTVLNDRTRLTGSPYQLKIKGLYYYVILVQTFYYANNYPRIVIYFYILDIIQKFLRTLVTNNMYERASDYENKLEDINC